LRMTAHRIDESICRTRALEDYEISGAAPFPPIRIVSLTPTASELISILGGMDKIVGRDDHSNFPSGLDEKPALGSSIRKTINVKGVVNLHPDVVVTGGHISPDTLEKIKASGIPVVIVAGNCDVKGIINNVKLLSEVLDAEKKAGELIECVEGYANLVKVRTQNLSMEKKPRVYHECAFRRYKTTAACTSANEVITLAGGVNIAHDLVHGKSAVNGEWVNTNNPDIILSQISTMSPSTKWALEEKRDEILLRPELKGTNAVRNGRVYISHLSIRRGPRMVGYLLYLAKWFHPELFSDIDPAAVEKEILQKFYGLDMEEAWAYPEI